jgi:undecaprenyl diphosphate synthase
MAEQTVDRRERTFSGDPEAVRVAAEMLSRNPKAKPLEYLPDVHPGRMPRHVAFIMDGNGRWATGRGCPRAVGHYNGVKTVREIVTACGDLGIEFVTLYSFSMENWKRPTEEVQALMELCVAFLGSEEAELIESGIRLKVIGSRRELPRKVLDAIDRVEASTARGRSATLCLAINYGSRAEIVEAAKALAGRVARGEIRAEEISEDVFASELQTAGMPDPDMLIRTAGEMRISNYLLWQISYAELYVTDLLWPDFTRAHLFDAIRAYASRSRRFGGLEEVMGHA